MTATQHGGAVTIAASEAGDLNPFGVRKAASNAGAEAENQRAIAEVQGAIVIAQRFPRDPIAAMDRILNSFARPTLAEAAMYSYARGGNDVTGPSIRAAETIAQAWGNMQFGVRELEQRKGESTVEAFAWDVETNTRSVKTFQVPHFRDTKQGRKPLTDSRDIYEHVANQGARRLRACILSVIPGDVVEAAMKQAETTLKTKIEVTPELVASLVDKFAKIGVPKEALEARIQRRLDAITPALVVQLGKIYNSINDGMSAAGDWFDVSSGEPQRPASRTEQAAELLRKAAAGNASQRPASAESAVESTQAASDSEKEIARKLRADIAEQWKGIDPKARAAEIRKRFNQGALTDLNAAQLREFLDLSPQLIGEIVG